MNNSTAADITKSWTFVPIMDTLILVAALLFNGGLLILFIVNRNLHTPFSVYLFNLILMTFIYIATQGPINILYSLYSKWWMGDALCTFLFYTIFPSSVATVHAHLLITVNRLWAITRPVSYKKYHNTAVAIRLCICMFLYCHVLPLYGVVMDGLYYKIPTSTGQCLINMSALWAWATATELLNYNFPIIFMVGCNAFLLYRRKKRFNARITTTTANTNTKTMSSHPENNSSNMPTMDMKKPPKEPKRTLVLLVCLTLSVVICWTPGVSFFTIQLVFNVELPYVWLQIGAMMFSAQSVVDPIVLALSFKDVRETIVWVVKSFRKKVL
ncbi:histamine H1 receptor-like [Paramacrobiotus metropolitanus]|uniref:histamine H1 receptor-like n=1 Tax=Paramacrobiotus metropolitanus TaxID=2943436 RepID=UPI0024456405|nr:histamine H1 receptor-like [Paramacrobiotus metropolitanus]